MYTLSRYLVILFDMSHHKVQTRDPKKKNFECAIDKKNGQTKRNRHLFYFSSEFKARNFNVSIFIRSINSGLLKRKGSQC